MHVYVICMVIVPSEIHGNTIQIFQTNSGTSLCMLWEKKNSALISLQYENHWEMHLIRSCVCALAYLSSQWRFTSLNIGVCNTLLFKIQIKLNQASITIESESVIPVSTCPQPLAVKCNVSLTDSEAVSLYLNSDSQVILMNKFKINTKRPFSTL